MTRAPELAMWEPAAPDGQRLVAAAPLIGDWVPSFGRVPILLSPFYGGSAALIRTPLGLTIFLIGYVVGFVILLGWVRRWGRHHPRPTGMAAILGGGRLKAPVLVVTDAAVLLTETEGPSLRVSRVRPAGVGRPIPGLVTLDAAGERLIARFDDGSETALRQRMPVRGAAAETMAEVARLAAPVVRRQRDVAPAEGPRRPW